ncbi:MAG: nucleotide sugar dehydrogenase [Clostridiales bacterium]|nr:nucleotide sugar dehydrogenase [Clostridiales bacterium]
MKKICVVGLGYIGIPTAVMFASKGYEVIGTDIRKNVVDSLNNLKLPIEEKGLDTLFLKHPFTAKLQPVIADVYIICVGTPTNQNKNVNLSAVKSASNSIIPYIKKDTLVIIESTIPPGTTKDIVLPIVEQSGLKAGKDFYLVHSPERVIPGNMLFELANNDRIMGGISPKGAIVAKELYKCFVKGKIYTTTATTAETAKLMENTFRNVNIALANEVASICEQLKINAWEVIELANKHPRVNILQPGPGVGGHCIPVDPWFIVEKTPKQATLIKQALEQNELVPNNVVSKIYNIANSSKGLKVCLLGCTYKANTDDIRESPTFVIKDALSKDNQVVLYDPNVSNYSNGSIYDACKDCDVMVLLVNHQQFSNIDYFKLATTMKNSIILDCKNFIEKEKAIKNGFAYYLIGDGSVNK